MESCRNKKNRGEKFCVSNHGIEQHNCEISRKSLKSTGSVISHTYSVIEMLKKVFIVNLQRSGLKGTTAKSIAQSRCTLRGMTLIRAKEKHREERKEVQQ